MDIFEYDKREGIPLLCGVDEAGRGPLAGDVYAAAVILPQDCFIEGLNDSKKLTPKKRDELYDIIKEKAISFSVGVATIAEIEEYNILNATFLAMSRAVDGLSVKPQMVLVDGNRNPKLSVHSKTVVKGDATSACIAAASILAKVERDRYMEQIALDYPEYQFGKHKGYGTALHYEMLDKFGVSPVHRKSFLKKYLSGEKTNAEKKGEFGENASAEYLAKRGYEILFRNYHSAYGEIDIIAEKENTIAFVEVKTRKAGAVIKAKEAVSPSKQQKIIRTALTFISENNIKLQPSFDVIEVYTTGEKRLEVSMINHLENAFDGGESDVYI